MTWIWMSNIAIIGEYTSTWSVRKKMRGGGKLKEFYFTSKVGTSENKLHTSTVRALFYLHLPGFNFIFSRYNAAVRITWLFHVNVFEITSESA
jgi:hypothetical protein